MEITSVKSLSKGWFYYLKKLQFPGKISEKSCFELPSSFAPKTSENEENTDDVEYVIEDELVSAPLLNLLLHIIRNQPKDKNIYEAK